MIGKIYCMVIFTIQSYCTSNIIWTRKSSCMNARGILTTAYQVLHLLSCTRWDTFPPVRVPPPLPGLMGYPPSDRGTPLAGSGWGTLLAGPSWGTPLPPCLDLGGYPPPAVDRQTDGWMDGQTCVKTLPSHHTMYAVSKNTRNDNVISHH